jgi:predicted RNase H-like nuclease (RuvC/YqgF family)
LEEENKEKEGLIDEYEAMVEELSQENEESRNHLKRQKEMIQDLERNLSKHQSMTEQINKKFLVFLLCLCLGFMWF